MNSLLPPSISPDDIETTIGLISDTHMPQRWPSLPTAVFQLFANTSLILHAGDVGELWVLDELSQIAPVIAVHGNDDTADSQRELPYQQLMTIKGKRILLWHSHYPNRVDEMHARRSSSLREGCLRSVARGKSAGAEVVVFGHWHTPLVFEEDGVLVINPGAIASGNHFRRQTAQTVALLHVLKNGRFHVTHINLAEPERPLSLQTDIDGGFEKALDIYGRSILSPELEALKPTLLAQLYQINPDTFLDAFSPLSRQVWSGQKEQITLADLKPTFQSADIKESLRQQFLAKLDELSAENF